MRLKQNGNAYQCEIVPILFESNTTVFIACLLLVFSSDSTTQISKQASGVPKHVKVAPKLALLCNGMKLSLLCS